MNVIVHEHPICGLCHRKLKSQKSRIDGFGPTCKKKHEHQQEMLVQVKIQQIQKEVNQGE